MAESKRSSGPPRRAIAAFAPVADALAGRRWFPLWAVVHHTGRKSGTPFATPVAIVPTVAKDVFLIGLPWGENTNWARNVVAAGGATLTWKGGEHRATAPRVIGGLEAASLSRALFRPVVSRFPSAIVLRKS